MNSSELESRYGRIIDLVDVPALTAKRVTFVGLGSMGQPVATQLVRHGVGTGNQGRIRLTDGDHVELRNLIGTEYRMDHVGMTKVEATASILHEINPDVQISLLPRRLESSDVSQLVEVARHSDLLAWFADDFQLLPVIAGQCYPICTMVTAFFGPRCDYAEVAFSVPDVTQPLGVTIGSRQRQAIRVPQALGCDTAFVTSFVAALCLRLLLGEGRGTELFPCYANAPLLAIGLRRDWLFAQQPPDVVRSVFAIGAPSDVP